MKNIFEKSNLKKIAKNIFKIPFLPSFNVIQNVAPNVFTSVSDVHINWQSFPTIWSGSYHDHPLVKHEWIWIYGNIRPLSYDTCYPSWSGLSHQLDIFANYLLLVTSNVNFTYLITFRVNKMQDLAKICTLCI